MSITLFRKPRGYFKEDINIYIDKNGTDSPNTTGTLKNPFNSLEYVLDKNNSANFLNSIIASYIKISLLNPPTQEGKGEKPSWAINVMLDDQDKQSRRILDMSGIVKPQTNASPIIDIKGVHDIIIINGMWTTFGTPTAPLIMISSNLNIAGISSILPQGDAYGIEIHESVFKDFPMAFFNIGDNTIPIPTIFILSAGDDCVINAVQFFNNYLALNILFTGEGFRIQNCVFKNCTKGIISDRRLLTLWNLLNQTPLDLTMFTWATLKNALKFARVINSCIFKGVDYPISDYDYFAQITGYATGNNITVTNSDFSLVTTSAGNYYPLSANELSGDIIVDSNFNEFKIISNTAFTGMYPFTITVVDESNSGKLPQGNTFYHKAYGQGTYLMGNIYADKQIDTNNDGVCDYAGTYPTKGYGLDACLYPDPLPLTYSSLTNQPSISANTDLINKVNNILNKLIDHEIAQAAHRLLESQRKFYFDINTISQTIKNMDKEITIYTGDTKQFTYTITDSEGAPFNLTNYTVKVTMKKYIDAPTFIFQKTADIISPTEGVFTYVISGSEITTPGNFILEYSLLDSSNNKITIAQQNMRVIKSLMG